MSEKLRILALSSLFLFILIVIVSCSSSDSKVFGSWSSGPTTIEFFKDKTWLIKGGDYDHLSGNWILLDDGRIKISGVVMGIQMTFLGKLNNDDRLDIKGDRKITGIYYRTELASCKECEEAANSLEASIVDWFAVPEHKDLPKNLSKLNIQISNPYTITGDGDPLKSITIQVKATGKCPKTYQDKFKDKNSNWDNGTYTKIIK